MKLFHQPADTETSERIKYLVEHPPAKVSSGCVARAWAWPLDAILDDSNRVVGVVTFLIENVVPWAILFDAPAREQCFPGLRMAHLPLIAANLMRQVGKTHDRGIVIGDLSPLNVLIDSQGGISFVDLESGQITTPSKVFPCRVGTPGYLAPELANQQDFASTLRDWRHDSFSAGALIYELLTGGVHFAEGCCEGVPADELPPSLAERVTLGIWHGSTRRHGSLRIVPPPHALDLAAFGPVLGALFQRCFEEGFGDPGRRPRIAEWLHSLKLYHRELQTCPKNVRHAFHRSLVECPVCEVIRRNNVPDPFPHQK